MVIEPINYLWILLQNICLHHVPLGLIKDSFDFISVAQVSISGPGSLIVDVSRSNTFRNTQINPVGLLWTSVQPVTEAATYTTQSKRRTSMSSAEFKPTTPSYEAAADLRLRRQSHRNRRSENSDVAVWICMCCGEHDTAVLRYGHVMILLQPTLISGSRGFECGGFLPHCMTS
jgi:hypothetical protein